MAASLINCGRGGVAATTRIIRGRGDATAATRIVRGRGDATADAPRAASADACRYFHCTDLGKQLAPVIGRYNEWKAAGAPPVREPDPPVWPAPGLATAPARPLWPRLENLKPGATTERKLPSRRLLWLVA